jgi:ribosome-associated heat shock protein Hsp15
LRLDKWLWAARFYKTRSLAQQAISKGHVRLNDERLKPSHVLKVGESVSVRKGDYEWKVVVLGLSDKRGPATEARTLYRESDESRVAREKKMELRRLSAEPAASIKGRPTKRDRRLLESLPVLDPDAADDAEA